MRDVLSMFRALAVGLALACLWHCSNRPTEVAGGGGGSEAVALVGTVTNPDGSAAANALVRLRPKHFLSDTAAIGGGSETAGMTASIRNVRTDAAGAFRMDSVKRGEYFVEISDSAGRGVLLPAVIAGDKDQVGLAKASLKPTGSVTGAIVPPEGFAGRTWVQVYGLERQVKADSATGSFRVDGMPGGTYTLRAVYSAPAVDAREIDSVSAVPDSITDIGALRLASFENENYAAWPGSKRLYLNTTAAGANVPGSVDDFPVLVRLDASNFNFAESNGNDIRFSDAQGKRLRYEIERWDSEAGRAEIWVRVDRVQGNANAQFLTLHWGVPKAESFSDGRQVFNAGTGFAGVWHLGEYAADTTTSDLYQDAVGYDPASDRTASADRGGVAGHGAGFGGTDYIAAPVADPLLQPNALITVSAWMRGTRSGLLGGTLATMGDSYNLRVNPNGTGRFSIFNGDAPLGVESAKGAMSLLDSAWHHLAGVYDGSTLSLYIDGKPAGKASAKGAIDYRYSPAFVMGKHGNRKTGYEFLGSLDEVEVSGEVARSADWIKLAYENQREGAKLVEFRP